MPFYNDNAAFGDVISLGVLFQVVADRGPFRDADVFIENGAFDLGAAPDVAVVEDDGIFDHRSGVNTAAASNHRVLHRTAGEN